MKAIAVFLLMIAELAIADDPDPACQLNGVRGTTDGTCHCDRGWVGVDCSRLNIGVSTGDAYQSARSTTSSFRGGVVAGTTSSFRGGVVPAAPGSDPSTYHLFVEQISGHCGLKTFSCNGEVVHATSPSPLGPFTFRDVVSTDGKRMPVPLWYNASTLLLFLGSSFANKTRLTGCTEGFTPGTTPGKFDYCPHNHSDRGVRSQADTGANATAPHLLAAPSPDGPWRAVEGAPLPAGCVTHSPVLAPNGSLYDVCFETRNHRGFLLYESARDYVGPWVLRANVSGFWPDNATRGDNPFVWVNARGEWHALWHLYHLQGGHAYSADGVGWHGSPTQAYNCSLRYAPNLPPLDGPSSCEGPQLVLDAARDPVGLLLARGGGRPGASDHVWTSAQPIEAGG